MKIRTILALTAGLVCLGTLMACKPTPPPEPGPDTPPEPPPEEGTTEEKYVYNEAEYFELLELFGKWEDNFASGGRSDTHVLTPNQLANGLYTQSRPAVELDGVRTYASVDHGYSPAMHLNVDAYIVSPKYNKDFKQAGYSILGTSGSFNKSEYSVAHPDVLQMDANGNTGSFWNSSVLTFDVVKFNISDRLRDMVNRSNWSVGFVEPEMFRYGGYGPAYKTLWYTKYDEPWSDPNGSVRSIFMSQRLNAWTHANAIKMYASYVNEKEGKTEHLYSVAPHSTLAYATYPGGVTDGFVHMMGTGQVETVTGQTWSNTIINSIRYQGVGARHTFLNAFVEYGTYLDAVNYYNTYFYALCDPMSDTYTQEPEEYWRQLCHEQLVASLMYPEINRWEFIWTNRSFMNVSPDYRSEQLNIHNAMMDISGKAFSLTAGTPGITYLLGDTLTWQSPDRPAYGENAYDGFWGVAAPIVYDGIPLRTMAMELITKPEDLENVSVLIVSYDNQKPLYEELNIAIAEWVKQGGTLLYLGGPDEYLNIPEAWWNQDGKGGSPTANLLAHLGVADSISVKPYEGGIKALNWKGGDTNAAAKDFSNGTLKVGGDAFTYCYEGSGFETLLETTDGQAIGITFEAGEGTVLMIGLSTTDYSDSAAAADLMRMLTAKATESTSVDYVKSDAFVVERGDYVAVYPFKGSYQLTGTYVNIFTPNLAVEINPVVTEGEAALYLRVKDTASLVVPTVAFAGGKVESINETESKTTIVLSAAENAIIPICITVPEGYTPRDVLAVYKKGDTLTEQIWDETTRTLTIRVFTTPKNPATVTVNWSKSGQTLEDMSYKSFKLATNSAGADADYIVKNTGKTNSTIRYTDDAAEIVWKFDIDDFRGLVVGVQLSQNYILEVSGDGETWTEVINYSKISSYRADGGTNDSMATILTGSYEDIGGTLYIRLRNTSQKGSWGGAVKSFTFQYLATEGEAELTPENLK